MKYEYTAHKILEILRMVPFALEEQLMMFFEGEVSASLYGEIQAELLAQHYILSLEQYGKYEVLAVTRMIRLKESQVREFLDAFWVIANMGAAQVNYVCIGEGPTKFCVVDSENRTSDITVCENAAVAGLGKMFRRHGSIAGKDTEPEEDDIRHIALVYSREQGEAMREELTRLDYDCYCVIDPDSHRAAYFPLKTP